MSTPAVEKDQSYHEAVAFYNREMAQFAAELAERVDHPEPQRWCKGIAKQHEYHARVHERKANRPTAGISVTMVESKVEDVVGAQIALAQEQAGIDEEINNG